MLTLPNLGLANRLPIWLTVLIISRDVVIVLTVAVVNLAIGPRTFRPSVFGKIATATYIVTAVVAMFFNYLGYASLVVTAVRLRVAGDHAGFEPALHLARVAHREHVRRPCAVTHFVPCAAAALCAGVPVLPCGASRRRRRPGRRSSTPRVGTFVIDLTPETAPNQVAYFIKQAQAGAYDGTTFHRMVKFGMVQGGDPLSKDPSKRTSLRHRRTECGQGRSAGAEDDARVGGRGPGAGPAGQRRRTILHRASSTSRRSDGQYTVFGKVNDGMEVVQKISETPIDGEGRATERVEIRHVTIRDTPPPQPEPFSTESPQELAGISRRARDVVGADHHRVLPRQGARATSASS